LGSAGCGFGEKFAGRFFAAVDPVGFDVYGNSGADFMMPFDGFVTGKRRMPAPSGLVTVINPATLSPAEATRKAFRSSTHGED
jgi:hypothetical protein